MDNNKQGNNMNRLWCISNEGVLEWDEGQLTTFIAAFLGVAPTVLKSAHYI